MNQVELGEQRTRDGSYLKRRVKEHLPKEATYKQRPEGREEPGKCLGKDFSRTRE